MKTILRQVDSLRLLALILMMLPALAIFGFGILWLWQAGNVIYWLVAMVVCICFGYSLQNLLLLRDRKLLTEAATEPNPDWPPSADDVWQRVIVLAETCDPQDWPLENGTWILALGQRTLETVSHCYHPEVDKPVLELTVPHTLLIIECASRDLRKDISENIPFSDRLTIGDLSRMQRWKDNANRVLNVYRAGRMAINPLDGLASEVWRHFRERSFGLARSELHRWILRAFVRKVGYYAIDLYSGRQPLVQEDTPIPQTSASSADMGQAGENSKTTEEPLRILVLGRANAGKSSLINALFGELKTATNVLSDTTQTLMPFVLLREGLMQALIFDSPGCDSTHFDQKQIQQAALTADLILWVSPANHPDRQSERECLDMLRIFQSLQAEHRPPPMLVAVSHIDQLRPLRSWQPPYDLINSQETKAINIRVAVQAIATDLVMPISQVIPVCLLDGGVYNVDDALWTAILNHQDEALKVRLYRCLDTKKKSEDWEMRFRQMINAGRFLWKLPNNIGKRSDS